MKSKKWRRLVHKVEYLKLDLEDKEEEMRAIEAQFITRLSEVDPGFNSPPPPPPQKDPPGEEIQEKTQHQVNVVDQTEPAKSDDKKEEPESPPPTVAADERPENMRKLWKAIALATHPDKTGGDQSKTDLYKRANRAWEERKYEELITIAIDLDIPTEEADENAATLLEARSNQISARISQIESSVLWQWHHAPEDKKDAIIRLYLASKGRRN